MTYLQDCKEFLFFQHRILQVDSDFLRRLVSHAAKISSLYAPTANDLLAQALKHLIGRIVKATSPKVAHRHSGVCRLLQAVLQKLALLVALGL